MNETKNSYLEDYNKISIELKYITNSLVRLRILFCLFDGEKTMKEINQASALSYSSISNNIHALEMEGYVIREHKKYSMSNVAWLYLKNLIEFNEFISILKSLHDFFTNHKVRNIPIDSISQLFQLKNCQLIESCGSNAHKAQNFLVNSLKNSDSVKAILPISFNQLTDVLVELVNKDASVDLILFNSIYDDFKEKIDFNSSNVTISCFKDNFNFMLIISDDVVVFGLYKKEGVFDLNRFVFIETPEGFNWAYNLFDEFKNK